MTKLCSFCLRQSLPVAKTENTCLLKKNSAFLFCLFQSCLLFQVCKMKETKNKQTRSEVFFFFLSTQQCCCARLNKTFFCFTIVQNQQAFGNCLWLKKKRPFFLLEKLRSYKKSVNIRDL